MSETQTHTKPAWLVWARVGGIIAALGASLALYGFISQRIEPIQIGQVIVIAGVAVAVVAGIWRFAAGRR